MHHTLHINSSASAVARLCIASAALLFLLSALLSSLPDPRTVQGKLDENAMAGYDRVSVTTPYREPILEEYYDYLPHSTASSVTSKPMPK